MRKYLVIVIFTILFLAQASALIINAPSVIEISDKKEFFIEITNTTNSQKELKVNFFSTVMSDVISPNFVPPSTTVKAKIIVYNKYDSYKEVNSKLEVYLDNEYKEKNIVLKFLEKNQRDSFEQQGADFTTGINSFFTLFAINTSESFLLLNNYFTLEVVAMTTLVLLILVLVVALIVRIVKRV